MSLIGMVQAAIGIIRHRYAVTNWLTAAGGSYAALWDSWSGKH